MPSTRLSIPTTLVTSPTPDPSPIVQTPSNKGKRKADEVDGNTPPDARKATFAASPRPLRASNATSNAPSSYHRQPKRARLSTQSEDTTNRPDTAATVGSWSSRRSNQRPLSRSQSLSQQSSLHRASSRRSLSQSSIPISALISPHAPSIALSSGHNAFHMRDPHKPPKVQPTGWTLAMGEIDMQGSHIWRSFTETGGSPLHAWLFFVGFVLFPVWWVASFLQVIRTRTLGHDTEGKGQSQGQVVLDDPQVEFDARTWRTRCRIMAVISFFTYIPFIVLVAVLVGRR
ncbi:WD-REPEATS-REGION domain-containing protein [Mycena indigotica]|uniref:WD-REPEATS-REGION domain-containing protein n=1 Tax=Mycena indigotica TaxID=2126181 RepID=A0A8H6W9D0_9AGAR|nr:WD-REPEATS-REGION domain-containing protein [Mycena indigotica]KAF7306483.1 WD-REPEATS-REGION domain-containing protein [Mycena indigotica]